MHKILFSSTNAVCRVSRSRYIFVSPLSFSFFFFYFLRHTSSLEILANFRQGRQSWNFTKSVRATRSLEFVLLSYRTFLKGRRTILRSLRERRYDHSRTRDKSRDKAKCTTVNRQKLGRHSKISVYALRKSEMNKNYLRTGLRCNRLKWSNKFSSHWTHATASLFVEKRKIRGFSRMRDNLTIVLTLNNMSYSRGTQSTPTRKTRRNFA